MADLTKNNRLRSRVVSAIKTQALLWDLHTEIEEIVAEALGVVDVEIDSLAIGESFAFGVNSPDYHVTSDEVTDMIEQIIESFVDV